MNAPALLSRATRRDAGFGRPSEASELLLDAIESGLDRACERSAYGVSRQARIGSPPVQSDLLGLIDRTDEQPDLNGQQLDVRQVDLDIADDDEAFVEDSVENVDQAVRARWIDELWQSVAPCEALIPNAR